MVCPDFLEILLKHKVILVTTNLTTTCSQGQPIPASSIDEALAMAFEEKGPDAEIVAIPDGVSVIAVK